ncbi:hypothetical protein MRX96_054339 [Rhipicephalus microplus]
MRANLVAACVNVSDQAAASPTATTTSVAARAEDVVRRRRAKRGPRRQKSGYGSEGPSSVAGSGVVSAEAERARARAHVREGNVARRRSDSVRRHRLRRRWQGLTMQGLESESVSRSLRG